MIELADLSMGSGQTLTTLWALPGEFAYIGAMSAFGSPPADTGVDAVNAGPRGWRVLPLRGGRGSAWKG